MYLYQHKIDTGKSQQMIKVTGMVQEDIQKSGIKEGIAVVFSPHTTAGFTINENADPDVRKDFQTFFNKLVPDGAPYFIHTLEGPDDMSAHIKASLIGSSVTIPIKNHKLNLGTWQGIYLCEFRDGGDSRKLSISIL